MPDSAPATASICGAALTFAGKYTAKDFALQSDHAGGTEVLYAGAPAPDFHGTGSLGTAAFGALAEWRPAETVGGHAVPSAGFDWLAWPHFGR